MQSGVRQDVIGLRRIGRPDRDLYRLRPIEHATAQYMAVGQAAWQDASIGLAAQTLRLFQTYPDRMKLFDYHIGSRQELTNHPSQAVGGTRALRQQAK